jgi:hypothetical protein
VDDRLPDAASNDDSQAILTEMRALRGLGYQLSVAAARDLAPDAASVAALAADGIICWRTPHYGSVEEVLRHQAGCFDVVYLRRAAMASRYLALVRDHCPRAHILCGAANLDRPCSTRQAQIEARPEVPIQRWRLGQAVPGAKVHRMPWARAPLHGMDDPDPHEPGSASLAPPGHQAAFA